MRRHASIACALAIGLVAVFGAGPAAAAGCPNEGIRAQQGVAHLPECRAYEMVSPVEKGGVDVLGYTQQGFTEAGPDGNSIAYGSSAAFGDVDGAAFPSIYRAVRGAGGWASSLVSPPQNATLLGGLGGGNTSVVNFFSSDLGAAIVRTNRSLAAGATENVPNLYSRDLRGGGYGLLSPGGPSTPSLSMDPPKFAWATPDLSAAVFGSREALTPGAPPDSSYKTYVYRNGGLELASVLTGGVPVAATPGNLNRSQTKGSISADGTQVFFIGESSHGLWVRDLAAGTTTEIVEPAEAAHVVIGALDGSRILWQGARPIDNVNQLYMYEVGSGNIVSPPDHEPEGPTGVGVWSTLAASDDLSSIYFTSKDRLVAGQPDPPADWSVLSPLAIYRWQPLEEKVTFVAYVNGGSGSGNQLTLNEFGADGQANRRDIATNPDGSVLAFATDGEVAPGPEAVYDNLSSSAACADEGDQRCIEVYRFDASTESVRCVSCPTGEATSDAGLLSKAGGTATANQQTFVQPHAVSSDGSRLFFETKERLAPGDVNGRYDVYMWKGGAPQLLTPGTSNDDFLALEASPSGEDLFVVTRAQMVGWDTDDLADLYDIRVGGGFPEPPSDAPSCAGDECQVPAEPPVAAEAASAALRAGESCPAARSGSRARRSQRLQAKARRLRARSARLRARAGRAHGRKAVRMKRQSRRLLRQATAASGKSRKLARRDARRRATGANCRGAK